MNHPYVICCTRIAPSQQANMQIEIIVYKQLPRVEVAKWIIRDQLIGGNQYTLSQSIVLLRNPLLPGL